MKLENKKANEALEEHLMWLVPEESDQLWAIFRPSTASPETFVNALRTWAQDSLQGKQTRRPASAKLLLGMRLKYLDMLDLYEQLRDNDPKYPHTIYTKAQLKKACSYANATSRMTLHERVTLVTDALNAMKYRKHAAVTPSRIAGLPHYQATAALIYWCLQEDS